MKTFKVISLLLTYPETQWLNELDDIQSVLAEEHKLNANAQELLTPLFTYLRTWPLIDLQQNYVATFDRNPSHSLHMYEHLFGESRERGAAMVDLMMEYRRYGLAINRLELPDYVPLFAEFLSTLSHADARELLGEAIHVLAHIGRKLEQNASPYYAVFKALEFLSPVSPQPLKETPVRNMEETMKSFGPLADGGEPLLIQPADEIRVSVPKKRQHP